MAVTVACVNLKGGVGKTAIAVNLAARCGARGLRTLLVDLDPQTNATFSCISFDDWRDHAANHGTVANLLGARNHTTAEGAAKTAADVTLRAVFPNVDLIPSHLDLFTVDLDLGGVTARELRLRKALASIQGDYDIIVCDCPPNLTIPTQNALAVSSHYVVPISPDFLSGLGIGLLITRIREFSADLTHNIELAGVVISRVGRAAHHRAGIIAALRQQFGTQVLPVEIQERVAVSESAAAHRPIYESRDADAKEEFRLVSDDLIARVGL
jgi:chromosome partitioning protein